MDLLESLKDAAISTAVILALILLFAAFLLPSHFAIANGFPNWVIVPNLVAVFFLFLTIGLYAFRH
jgi:hypothetical protein